MERPLISRKILFGNPHRTGVRISPDGERLAWLAAENGVMNVWVAPAGDLDSARVVTHDRSTGIAEFHWAYTSQHILFLQDQNGDEDFHLFSVDLATGEILDLTPFAGIAAQLIHISHRFPTDVLVGVNDRDQHWFHDIHRINIVNGHRELIEENNQFAGFIADDDLKLRFALALTATSDLLIFEANPRAEDGWSEFLTVPAEEVMTTAPISLSADGKRLYLLDSRGRDTAAIKSMNLETGKEELIFATEIADVSGILTHPTENSIQAVTYTYDRVKFEIVDDSLKKDFEFLNNVCSGDLEIVSQTKDQALWIVAFTTDNGPVRYYRYDRLISEATFLFSHRPELEDVKLSRMWPQIIRSRDGLELVSYLTLPLDLESVSGDSDLPAHPLPLVLLVHGGPWWRDNWGFNPLHQLLADRGYAVLSVNFRGSTGFGKSFVNAANGEWAGRMQDDLIDAVEWAVDRGVADKDRIAIMGGSYGGYATLVGMTMTPRVFACGIDIVGPSSLITLMENPPPYWIPIMPMMTTRVGDPASSEGRKMLEAKSPLFHVDRIERPLLIGQGANDPRVKQSESDQIVAAMNNKGFPVTYVLYPDEGHGFDRPENDISFYAICEAFLARNLGGRFEETGSDFAGANFEVLAGIEHVPGLQESLAAIPGPRSQPQSLAQK